MPSKKIIASELLLPLMMILLQHRLYHACGDKLTGGSNFQVLTEDVDLGPLSQRPELFKVAAVQNEVVTVTDDQQTVVVTVGVDIRLDWSSWVTEVLDTYAESALTTSQYTYYRTHVSESGSIIGPAEELRPSQLPFNHIVVRASMESYEFYVELSRVVVRDRAVYELEACLTQPDSEKKCRDSNVTVYIIERPNTLEIVCMEHVSTVTDITQVSCSSSNPIISQSCALEANGVRTSISCGDIGSTINISSFDFLPERYDFSMNATDVYGQRGQTVIVIHISQPMLSGNCSFEGLKVRCVTSYDGTLYSSNITFNCSYDGEPYETCGQSFTIDKKRFEAGCHHLDLIVIGPVVYKGPTSGPRVINLLREPYQFNIRCGCSPQCDITEEEGGEITSTTPPSSGFIISRPLPTVVAGDEKADLALIGGTIVVAAILLFTGVILLIVILLCCTYQIRRKKMTIQQVDGARDFSLHSLADSYNLDERDLDQRKLSVESSLILDLPTHLIVPSANIKLNETIGEGEFGVVFKGYIIKFKHHDGQDVFDEYLAIKTLKGFYDRDKVRDMLKECLRMSKFNHLHVLTLKRVCLDGGPAPYIIMPFMANGSLLAYLRKNRKTLIVSNENNDDVEMVRKQLMDMCIQIAKGMEYLASMKVVHRDLAARNCMIDANHVIKIADFGLSESIGVKEYFRRDEKDVVLPLKWLALETLTDNIFSEKTDVWAYRVTCWEIFSGGKVPYTELRVREIPKQLAEGYRLKSPSNDACNDEMYSMMLQCWLLEPEKRPSFSQLVRTLSELLEYMADYVHIGAFGMRTHGADISKTIN